MGSLSFQTSDKIISTAIFSCQIGPFHVQNFDRNKKRSVLGLQNKLFRLIFRFRLLNFNLPFGRAAKKITVDKEERERDGSVFSRRYKKMNV